jgi:hypothetical protein
MIRQKKIGKAVQISRREKREEKASKKKKDLHAPPIVTCATSPKRSCYDAYNASADGGVMPLDKGSCAAKTR